MPDEGFQATSALPAELAELSNRLDRLSLSRWHFRCLALTGTAHFFDAFDLLILAFALPLIIAQWGLSTFDAAITLAAAPLGQLAGAVFFGGAADRFGRVRVLGWTLAIFAIFSCAAAFSPGFLTFLLFRFLQGVGLGGETPVAATYVNEISPSRVRGRLVNSLQLIFGLGLISAAAISARIIPQYGWHAMFLIGALPLLLSLVIRRLLPESPRWLVAQGRTAEALATVAEIERRSKPHGNAQPAARPANSPIAEASRERGVRALFGPGMIGRTLSLWLMAMCASMVGYGILNWMPTFYSIWFHLPLATALHYGTITTTVMIGGSLLSVALIDLIGRRWLFVISLAGGGIPLLLLAGNLDDLAVTQVVMITTLAGVFLSFVLGGVYVYAPEIYPVRLRSIGAGLASAWLRVGTVVGPLIVGWMLPRTGLGGVILFFGVTAVIGALAIGFFGEETKGKVLDVSSA